MKSAGWRAVIGLALLMALIAVAQWTIGWGRLLEPWRTIPFSTLALAVALTLASYTARMLRVYDYFLPTTRGRSSDCLRLTLFHNLFNNFLPMRSGETSFPVLMARYFGTPVALSLTALLWFRLMDLHVLAGVALVTVGSQWLSVPFLVASTALWMGLAWWLYQLQSSARVQALTRFLPAKWDARLRQARSGLPQSASAFWRAWLWTFANWFVKLAVFAWVLQLFTPMPTVAALLGAIGGDLTSVLPVHGIAGAGTYEAGVVSALLPFGVPPKAALAAAVNLHLFMLGMSLVGGALGMLIGYPRPRER